MKKVLLASTALVATAGFAAAEVSLSARAEMGIFGASIDDWQTLKGSSGTPGTDESNTQFFTDIDVTFSLSGETDGGLSFGAAVDLDESHQTPNGAMANNADDGGIAIFISGDFGTLTMGDTDGALDWALTEAGNINNGGSIADDETTHVGYVGSYGDGAYDNQIVRYDNTFGDFGVAISLEMDDGATPAAGTRDTGYAIGFKYSADLGGTTVNLGIGHQSVDTTAAAGGTYDITGISANAGFGDFAAGFVYADWNGAGTGNDSHWGIGGGYSANGLTLHANYGVVKLAGGAGENKGWGLSAAYDLGGGAVVHAGYGNSDLAGATPSFNTFSLGLGLSF